MLNVALVIYLGLHVFSAQGGHYTKAKELLELGLKIEKEELGERDERMVQLNYLTGNVEDEVSVYILVIIVFVIIVTVIIIIAILNVILSMMIMITPARWASASLVTTNRIYNVY